MSDKKASLTRYARGLISRPTSAANSTSSISKEKNGSLHHAPSIEIKRDHFQSTSIELDGAINAMAANSDRSQVAVAGREVLKVLNVGHAEISESTNLRAGNRANLNYSSNDVKWGVGATESLLATATSNGTVVIWDLGSPNARKVDRVITAHNRAVNRLCFNPAHGSWLLSASQDGTMKLWDLRDRDGGPRSVLHGKAEAVREVQFNHVDCLAFAAVFDNGTLQKWDLRRPSIYERKLNAHNGLALALDWHDDGRHLATGGRDKVIKVWDMADETRKPVAHVYTMAPVARVAWRPGAAPRSGQIASCSFSLDNRVHLWDLRRPCMASRVFESHDSVVTGILWRDEDTLWSCSKDKRFFQHDVSLAAEPMDYVSHYGFGWSPLGDLAVAIGNRVADRVSLGKVNDGSGTEPLFDPLQPPYRPVQSVATLGFGAAATRGTAFKRLALEYCISHEDKIAACAHNAASALSVHRYQASKTWDVVRLVLEQEQAREAREAAKARTNANTGESLLHQSLERLRVGPASKDASTNGSRSGSGSGQVTARPSPSNPFIMPEYDDTCNTEEEGELSLLSCPMSDPRPVTAGTVRSEIDSGLSLASSSTTNSNPWGTSPPEEERVPTPSASSDSSSLHDRADAPPPDQPTERGGADDEKPWRLHPVLQRLIDFHADLGDVQMCATLSLVLGPLLPASRRQREEWLCCYVELLQRHRLDVTVAEVVGACDLQSVREIGGQDAEIHASCGRCGKAGTVTREEGRFWWCSRCRTVSLCVICQSVVKGSVSWCRGCGHSGHSRCVAAWFAANQACPAVDCLHSCSF